MAPDLKQMEPKGETHPFLGREIAQPRDFSEKTAQLIDEEIRAIVRDMEKKAEETVSGHLRELDILARELHERETLGKEEIEGLLDLPSRSWLT
jgi:cell division protease FtsH